MEEVKHGGGTAAASSPSFMLEGSLAQGTTLLEAGGLSVVLRFTASPLRLVLLVVVVLVLVTSIP